MIERSKAVKLQDGHGKQQNGLEMIILLRQDGW